MIASEYTKIFSMSEYFNSKTVYFEDGVSNFNDSTLIASHILYAILHPYSISLS